jgi:hypothetical protein
MIRAFFRYSHKPYFITRFGLWEEKQVLQKERDVSKESAYQLKMRSYLELN